MALLLAILHPFHNTFAQAETNVSSAWTVGFKLGSNLAVGPFSPGYGINAGINHFSVEGRYMPGAFGLKSNIWLDKLQHPGDGALLPFHIRQFNVSLMAVSDLVQLIDKDENNKFGLLFQAGGILASFNALEGTVPEKRDRKAGFMLGAAPFVKITPSVSFTIETNLELYFRQHQNWDAHNYNTEDWKARKLTLAAGLLFHF